MYTPYPKIETLYERNTERREDGLKPGALLPELTLKNPAYGVIKEWVWTEKIDGTNMRVEWTPRKEVESIGGTCNGEARLESLIIGGKTDRAQIHGALLERMTTLFTAEKLRELFPDKAVTFYGEGYGAGIQKTGGSYKTEKDFIGFDIFVHDPLGNPFGGFWLSDLGMRQVYAGLRVDVVPYIGTGSLVEAAGYVRKGFKSKVGIANAEGLVGRTALPLFDGRGHRLITKLKTVDFDPDVSYNTKPWQSNHIGDCPTLVPFEN